MEKITIQNKKIFEDNIENKHQFPKYTSQLINLASRTSQATRPKHVGQLTDLIEEFKGNSFEAWGSFYKQKNPKGIDGAVEKIMDMLKKFIDALENIDPEIVKDWLEDLILTKTYTGLKFQKSILKAVAEKKGVEYRLSTAEEESRGIDGFIGDEAVQVKPESYKMEDILGENITIPIIYYKKKKDGIDVEYNF